MTQKIPTSVFSLVILAVSAAPAFAQTSLNQADMQAEMQQMMAAMQAMQQCMAGLDENSLQRLEARGDRMDGEIRALCAAGKRDEAQRKAVAFSAEFMSDPAARTMQACAERLAEQMESQMIPSMRFMDLDDESDTHVCDESEN